MSYRCFAAMTQRIFTEYNDPDPESKLMSHFLFPDNVVVLPLPQSYTHKHTQTERNIHLAKLKRAEENAF